MSSGRLVRLLYKNSSTVLLLANSIESGVEVLNLRCLGHVKGLARNLPKFLPTCNFVFNAISELWPFLWYRFKTSES